MVKYETHFIPQNILLSGYVEVYNGSNFIGKVKANGRETPNLGEKLYSVGALSDIHADETNKARLKKALEYFNNVEKVAFTCISGDLTNTGTEAELQAVGQYLKEYSPTRPVYVVTGNHDLQALTSAAPFDYMRPYTGQDLYYTVPMKDDVFIMFGMSGWYSYTRTSIFSEEALDWLEDTLNANKGKRCFVFEHCTRFDGSGKPSDWPAPTGEILLGDAGERFKSLMSQNTKGVWFHGHTHLDFECQKKSAIAVYDRLYGCHSVHIPSLAGVRTLNSDGTGYDGSANKGLGYVIDVYPNHIVLRGLDFVADKFVPIATYCLET